MADPDSEPDPFTIDEVTDRGFCGLYADAIQLALLSAKPPRRVRPYVFARASLLLSVGAAEAAINGVLQKHLPFSRDLFKRVERLTFFEKIELVAAFLNRVKEFRESQAGFAAIGDLMDVRSKQLHHKDRVQKVARKPSPELAFEATAPDESKILKMPFDHLKWNFDTATKALLVIDEFLTLYLLKVCGLTPSEIAHSIMSGVRTADGVWRATIMMHEHYAVWRAGKRRCKVRLAFLGDLAVEPSRRKNGRPDRPAA